MKRDLKRERQIALNEQADSGLPVYKGSKKPPRSNEYWRREAERAQHEAEESGEET